MKKHYLLLFCSLLFASCGYDIANNSRLEFTGTVTDSDGNPLPETFVYLQGTDYTGGSIMSPANEQSENLGENYTDNSGNFRVVSLKTSTNIFHINRSEGSHFNYDEDNHVVYSDPTNNTYTAVDFINVSASRDFGTIELRKKAELLFKIHKTSATNDTLTWQLSYTHANCVYIYSSSGYLNQEESSCYENFSDYEFRHQQDPSEPNFERIYQTVIGGIAEFIYQINDQPEQSIQLNIDETQETYVFEY